jgi:hypothetical protein
MNPAKSSIITQSATRMGQLSNIAVEIKRQLLKLFRCVVQYASPLGDSSQAADTSDRATRVDSPTTRLDNSLVGSILDISTEQMREFRKRCS